MLLIGNCLDKLKELEEGSVQTCVTSPPYWGLRDYDDADQLGQEDYPETFVENLTEIFMEVHRVLKDDGTLWLNIGDTYFGAKGGHFEGANSITNDGSDPSSTTRIVLLHIDSTLFINIIHKLLFRLNPQIIL